MRLDYLCRARKKRAGDGFFLRWTPYLRRRRILAQAGCDERIRLENACRLHDRPSLEQLARCAFLPAVRLAAAREIGDQQALMNIALAEWDIQRGRLAVGSIHAALLLQRIARYAHQDAIRWAAALRLNAPKLIRWVYQTTREIHLRWEIARYLQDPLMMAEIALHKPTNEGYDDLRRKARRAMLRHLDALQWQGQTRELLAFMYLVPHAAFKIEAAMRLSKEGISPAVLRYLSGQDFRYAPAALLKQLFVAIQSIGWHASRGLQNKPCAHCHGTGKLPLKCSGVADDSDHVACAPLPCPECLGQGQVWSQVITCTLDRSETVTFCIPHDASMAPSAVASQ